MRAARAAGGLGGGLRAAGGCGAGHGEGRRNRARAARPAKAQMELLEEAGGLRLHLDPRRHLEGYAGTGYKGVSKSTSNIFEAKRAASGRQVSLGQFGDELYA